MTRGPAETSVTHNVVEAASVPVASEVVTDETLTSEVAQALGDKCLLASDLLQYLPNAMEECADLPHRQ